MNKSIFFVFCLFCFPVVASERIAVEIPSDDERQVQDLLDSVKAAVDNEDVKSYLSCMTKELASKNKKKVALMFMHHDMDMELHKFEIMESSDDSIEFIVKYTWHEDSKPYNFVSSVLAKKNENKLLISKEEILSKKSSKDADVDFTGTDDQFQVRANPFVNGPIIVENDCKDGQCRLGMCPPKRKHVPVLNEQGQEVLEGVSFWNDENGNPDPNGIMWVPPGLLFKKFPDKYGIPDCMRAKMGIK